MFPHIIKILSQMLKVSLAENNKKNYVMFCYFHLFEVNLRLNEILEFLKRF